MSSLFFVMGTPDPATARPHPVDTLARWWLYLSAAATIGPIIFLLFVWRPVQAQIAAADEGQTEQLLRQLGQWGAVAGLGGSLLLALVQAWQIGDGGWLALVSGRGYNPNRNRAPGRGAVSGAGELSQS